MVGLDKVLARTLKKSGAIHFIECAGPACVLHSVGYPIQASTSLPACRTRSPRVREALPSCPRFCCGWPGSFEQRAESRLLEMPVTGQRVRDLLVFHDDE